VLRDLFFGLPGRLSWVHHHSVAALAGMKTGWVSGRIDLARYDPPESAANMTPIAARPQPAD
jgi:hypothetical protein